MATQLAKGLTEAEVKSSRLVDKLDDPLDYLSVNYQAYCVAIYIYYTEKLIFIYFIFYFKLTLI